MANTPMFSMRLTPERRAAWEAAAKSAGLSLSDWIKTTADQAAGTTTRLTPVVSPPIQSTKKHHPQCKCFMCRQ